MRESALDRDPGGHQEGTKVCTTWEKGHLPGPGYLLKADHSPESYLTPFMHLFIQKTCWSCAMPCATQNGD